MHTSHQNITERVGKAKLPLTCIVCLLLSCLVLFFSAVSPESGIVGAGKSVVNTLVYPLRALGNSLGAPARALNQASQAGDATQATYEELEAQNNALVSENASLKEKEAELNRLQDLLSFKNDNQLETVAAAVIGRGADGLTSSITINQGKNAGIEVGMAVTDATGAIGQVTSVAPFSATVRLITDARSSISAIDQETRVVGEIQGENTDTVKLVHIPASQTIQVGDQILTSGLGGTFPKGIPIGSVTSVDKPQGAQYYDISVKLYSHPQTVENVLVITGANATADEAKQ